MLENEISSTKIYILVKLNIKMIYDDRWMDVCIYRKLKPLFILIPIFSSVQIVKVK